MGRDESTSLWLVGCLTPHVLLSSFCHCFCRSDATGTMQQLTPPCRTQLRDKASTTELKDCVDAVPFLPSLIPLYLQHGHCSACVSLPCPSLQAEGVAVAPEAVGQRHSGGPQQAASPRDGAAASVVGRPQGEGLPGAGVGPEGEELPSGGSEPGPGERRRRGGEGPRSCLGEGRGKERNGHRDRGARETEEGQEGQERGGQQLRGRARAMQRSREGCLWHRHSRLDARPPTDRHLREPQGQIANLDGVDGPTSITETDTAWRTLQEAHRTSFPSCCADSSLSSSSCPSSSSSSSPSSATPSPSQARAF